MTATLAPAKTIEIEVFRAGDYGGKGSYTPDDLKLLAESYDPEAKHEAPVTVDHEQSGPAFGWVKGLVARGKSLFANVHFTVPEFLETVRGGLFKKRSIEIYRDYEGTGKPYFAALTFLGAARPHVKGMADATFSIGGSTVTLDFEELGEAGVAGGNAASTVGVAAPDATSAHGKAVRLSPAHFAEVPATDPNPDGHGVIVQEHATSDGLSHYHIAYLDEEGNGFTSYPVRWDDGEYRSESSGHIHGVRGWSVEAAGDGIEHTHSLHKPQMFSEKEGRKDTMAEETKKETKGEGTDVTTKTEQTEGVDKAKFAELESAHKAATEELAKLRDELAKQRRDTEHKEKMAAFKEAINDLCDPSQPRLTPGERDNATAIYSALVSGGDGKVKFGETEHPDIATAFVEFLKARPVIANFDEDMETDPAKLGDRDATASNKAEVEKVRKYAAENKCTFAEALVALEREAKSRA